MTPEALTEAGEHLFPGLQWSTDNPFADALGVHWRTVLKWRRGENRIHGSAAKLIQQLLREEYA